MLEVDAVTFAYPPGNEPVLTNVSAQFSSGHVYRILGFNGGGKTTLGYTLAGAIPHFIRGRFEGQVLWDGRILDRVAAPRVSSYLFQDPYIYFVGYRVQDEYPAECPAIHPGEMSELLTTLLPDIDTRLPLHVLSTGEQQRLALSSAVARSNQLLILDEPFNYLDEPSQKTAAQLLSARAQSGTTVVVFGSSEQFSEILPSHEQYWIENGRLHESRQPLTESSDDAAIKLRDFTPGEAILSADDVSFSYDGNKMPVIDRLSVRIREGEILGVSGRNGSGKSTLLYLLAGLLHPTHGQIRIQRKVASKQELRQKVRLVFQKPDSQLFCPTVREELIFSLVQLGFSANEQRDALERAQALIPFALHCDPFSLSYGQRRFLTYVLSLITNPTILLLDEPTASLDSTHRRMILELTLEFARNGGAVVITSHESRLLQTCCHCIVDLNTGSLNAGSYS